MVYMSRMKVKILSLIIMAIFLFSWTGFCDESVETNDGAHHCFLCCSASCCKFVSQKNQPMIFPAIVSIVGFSQELFCQNPFLANSAHPPNFPF